MRRVRVWAQLLVLAALSCALCACLSPMRRVAPGTLRVAQDTDMSSMDVARTSADYQIPINVFDRLFETRMVDGEAALVNSLCTDYTVSDDGLTYNFTLRDGVLFSNGDPLTSADVKYSFERLLAIAQANTDISLEIKGGQAMLDGEASELEGFVIQDDTHFSITLEGPNAGFTAELSSPAMSIVNAKTTRVAQNFGIDPAETIGSGPYKVMEWVTNDHTTLEYNENYWGEEPSVKRCVIYIIPDASTRDLMFQNGELDLLDLESIDTVLVEKSYKVDHADKIVSTPNVGETFIILNERNTYLKDANVRKAINMAIDVDSIIASIYGGAARHERGIIPTGVWGHNDELEGFRYDVEQARKILADAGYSDGEIHFELLQSSEADSNIQLVYQAVSHDLSAIGIDAQIKIVDDSAYYDIRGKGEADAYIAYWLMDYNDPANIMSVYFGGLEASASRSFFYSDEQVMDGVAHARFIVDDDERKATYQELERKIVMEDVAWLPLVESEHLFCLGERVKVFIPHWAGFSAFYMADVVLE